MVLEQNMNILCQIYYILIYYILEINIEKDYTPVQGGSPFIKGLFNLRGEIVTLLNMEKYLGFEEDKQSDSDAVIILKVDKEINETPGVVRRYG